MAKKNKTSKEKRDKTFIFLQLIYLFIYSFFQLVVFKTVEEKKKRRSDGKFFGLLQSFFSATAIII